jgi:hypothetical protein
MLLHASLRSPAARSDRCAGRATVAPSYAACRAGKCTSVSRMRAKTLGVRAKRLHPPQHPRNLYRLRQFGTDASADPQTGDVMVFRFSGSDHHVTLLERITGDYFVCRGGNQSHQVKVSVCRGIGNKVFLIPNRGRPAF